jgi:D-alanine-D-alanine ligase
MKKNIALVFGGYSAEQDVSVKSAEVVYNALDKTRFAVTRVKLTPEKWVALSDDGEEHPISLNDFSFTRQGQKTTFDAVFNAVHGNPGEDGPLAGYFELMNLKQTASGQFESALTFNKAECNRLLNTFGIKTPQAVFLIGKEDYSAQAILEKVGLPCFVKPSRSGSSIGVSKVKALADLEPALAKARAIDSKILIESMVSGTEVGCGVSNHTGSAKALAVTDIVPANDFFDFESKYNGQSEEVTPARIDSAVYQKIMAISEKVYTKLNLNGLARMDYIINADQEPVLIEVNTVPGFSAESILPKQAAHAGYTLAQLFNATLQNTLNS